MADEKPKTDAKPDAKPAAPAPEKTDPILKALEYLLILVVLSGLVTNANNFINSNSFLHKGLSGLSRQSLLLSNTRPLKSVLHPIGGRVIVSSGSTFVLDEAGGKKIGTQRFGARGVVEQGPVTVGGHSYYYVNFENGKDGWVEENSAAYVDGEPTAFARFVLQIWSIVLTITYILYGIAFILFVLLVTLIRKTSRIRKNVKEQLYPLIAVENPNVSHNPHWERIITHVESENESNWRLAVIEADIMLSELLDTMHLSGDSIGEKLKAVEKSDFTTLDLAWEAHKIRNQIAHDNTFLLSQREARRVIGLFEAVFKEFGFV